MSAHKRKKEIEKILGSESFRKVFKDFAEDSMFPFKGSESIFVKVSFKLGDNKLLIEKWEEKPS